MAELFADIRYVLFDWGGTLCSIAGEAQAWRRAIAALLATGRRQGLALKEGHADSLITLFLTTRAAADADPEHKEIQLVPVLRDWLAGRGLTEVSRRTLETMNRAYWDQWIGCLCLLEGADRTLGLLRGRGYRLGLVSNVATPPHWCRLELQRLGLLELLDCVTFSSELGVRKPHPRIYDQALWRLGGGRPAEARRVLFVGDSPLYDVAEPAARGMRTVLVRDRAGRWPEAHYQGLTPDLTVDRVAELLPYLPGPD